MLSFLPGPIIGVLTTGLAVINLTFWILVLYITAFIRMLIPVISWKLKWEALMQRLPNYWLDVNDFIMFLLLSTKWDVEELEGLQPKGWYLLMCNHQSFVDTVAIEKIFKRKIPMLKFFMKKELRWVPLLGDAARIMRFPFMERYSKEFLEKHPEMKGKDIETARKSCEKFKDVPTTIVNYSEGTRFTEEKHRRQASPYQHLLKPRAGGIAFVLSVLGDSIDHILDVSIAYPNVKIHAWDFLCNRIPKIVIRVTAIPVTDELRGDYQNDPAFRASFQSWINQYWEKKDKIMDDLLKQNQYYENEKTTYSDA